MARVDWKVSATPIQSTAAGADAGPMQTETLAYDVQATLGGGNSNGTWVGTDVALWVGGVHTHVEAFDTAESIAVTGDDLVFIKHTGRRFDSTTADKLKADGTEDLTVISVYLATVELCQLSKGEAICLPAVKGTIKVGSADSTGTAPAAQVMVLS